MCVIFYTYRSNFGGEWKTQRRQRAVAALQNHRIQMKQKVERNDEFPDHDPSEVTVINQL